MGNKNLLPKLSIMILVILCFCFIQSVFGQADRNVNLNEKAKPILIDYLKNDANGEQRSASIDNFLVSIQNNQNSKGFIIVYCGKVCKYGEVEAHIRGIKEKIENRRFDFNKILTLNGGFKEKQLTELWLIPEGVCPPLPKSEIKIEDVEFKGTHKVKVVPHDCC